MLFGFILLLVAVGLVPLAAISLLAVRQAEVAVRAQAEAGLQRDATLGAAMLEQEMEGVLDLVDAYARRRMLLAAFQDASPAERRRHLVELAELRQGIVVACLADADGDLLDLVPETPGIVGRNFAHRDWYRGARERRGQYLSEAYLTAAAGAPRVVAAAVPVLDPTGEIAGFVIAGFGTDSVRAFTESFARSQGVSLTIVDQRGNLIAAPGDDRPGLVPLGDDPRVAAALAGRSGILEVGGKTPMLSSYAPAPTLGWAVIAEMPSANAFAGIEPIERSVYGGATVLGVMYVGLLGGLYSALQRRREVVAHLEESERLLHAMIEHAGALISVKDLDGRYVMANSRFGELTGLKHELM
ncbi:MAG: PAS domain S-box protein, partial [Deltaproteobacteria bacterium]|nr:PAS domain S-box protein [Deltaproteobacteria bacterium]